MNLQGSLGQKKAGPFTLEKDHGSKKANCGLRYFTLTLACLGVILTIGSLDLTGRYYEGVRLFFEEQLRKLQYSENVTERARSLLYGWALIALPYVAYALTTLLVIQLVMHLLLLIGAYKKVPFLILLGFSWNLYPWIMHGLIATVYAGVYLGSPFNLLLCAFFICLTGYFLWCIYAYFVEVHCENLEKKQTDRQQDNSAC